ncbi:serine kinase [Paenibacillus darwinianus]|uniref:Homoserine kinase n=1 Tax=Paenibacillus darwinianus TaxID=1380763 RepID=A0A9W5RZ86_9BACL|nr:homoserine kinase [Paenibacillus darwinianus]EXX85554.1 serine kinase [Paenibacillus darwinianus]EXX85599.1 serine kinase [Paenibacillus darwinianus]EXX85670.1 serine kinase [Paenibacillus darwinianus]
MKLTERRVLAKVPASTANLGPGFDTLGMALSLYAWIEMGVSETGTAIELHGRNLRGLPTDKNNLIYKVAQLVFNEAEVDIPELHIAMYSDIPLTRGLGSSASAIVCALAAANALIGSPLDDDRLFQIATRLEGHPDNVGASVFGGIVVASWDGNRASHIRLEPSPDLDVLVAIPDFQLSTEKARHALPDRFPMADVVFNVSRSSLLVAALATGNHGMIRTAMQDRMHQPYRAALIPGMAGILDGAAERGALGAALSGAGPTLLALIESGSPRKQELERFLLQTLAAEGITAEALWLKPAAAGPELTVTDGGAAAELAPLMERIKGEVRV